MSGLVVHDAQLIGYGYDSHIPHLNFTVACTVGSLSNSASRGLTLRRISTVKECSCDNERGRPGNEIQ